MTSSSPSDVKLQATSNSKQKQKKKRAPTSLHWCKRVLSAVGAPPFSFLLLDMSFSSKTSPVFLFFHVNESFLLVISVLCCVVSKVMHTKYCISFFDIIIPQKGKVVSLRPFLPFVKLKKLG